MPDEMKPIAVREKLVEALQIDLVGPGRGLGDPKEVLPQAPSRWYLTGFLVPLGAKPEQRKDETAEDDLDEAGETGEVDENVPVEKAAARPRFFPSSIGASVIVPSDAVDVKVRVRWGDYRRRSESLEEWERTDAGRNSLHRSRPCKWDSEREASPEQRRIDDCISLPFGGAAGR